LASEVKQILRPDVTLLQVQNGSVRELYTFLPDDSETKEYNSDLRPDVTLLQVPKRLG